MQKIQSRVMTIAAIAAITALAAARASAQESRPRLAAYSEAVTSVTVPAAAPDSPDVAATAEAFGRFTRPEFAAWLSTVTTPAPAPAEAARVAAAFRSVVRRFGPRPSDSSGPEAARLRARILPILRLFGRENLTVVLADDPEPHIDHVVGAGLIVTTGMLRAAPSDDQLCGWVAHALARERHVARAVAAVRTGDDLSLRRIELECDAVAADALFFTGMDPLAYAQSVFAVVTSDPERASVYDGLTDHPSLADRLRLIERLAKSLKGYRPARTHMPNPYLAAGH
jgi:hypothetical protein